MNPRILLAVGRVWARAMLRRLFEEEFSGVVIVDPATTEEAAPAFNSPDLAVVVLDAKLPAAADRREEYTFDWLDQRLRQRLRDRTLAPPTCFVLAPDLEDAAVASRRRLYERDDDQVQPVTRRLLTKSGTAWVNDLREGARKVLHPKRIEAQLEDVMPLFDALQPRAYPSVTPNRIHSSARENTRYDLAFGNDPSYRVALFMRDIEKNWRYLDNRLQERLGEIFVIESLPERHGGVEVNLL